MKVKFYFILKVLTLFVIIFSMTGCWDQRIFEKVGFILNLGLDKSGENIILTLTAPVIHEREQKVDVNTVTGRILREGREYARLESPRRIEGGKIQNILIGESIALEGINKYFEVLERSISNPTQSWVLIVEGSANEFITKGGALEGKPRLAFYLNELLDSNTKGGYSPAETVIRYDIDVSIPGLDPIVPIVKLQSGHISITGTALMDGDRMTGRMDFQDTASLMIVRGESRTSMFFFELSKELIENKEVIAVSNRKSSTKTKITLENDIPKASFQIDLKLILEEYSWNDMANREKELKLEDFMALSFETRLKGMFKKLQEANCDAIGIGDKIRAKYNEYWMKIGEEAGWKKIYPRMTAEFNVKTDITRYGVIQ